MNLNDKWNEQKQHSNHDTAATTSPDYYSITSNSSDKRLRFSEGCEAHHQCIVTDRWMNRFINRSIEIWWMDAAAAERGEVKRWMEGSGVISARLKIAVTFEIQFPLFRMSWNKGRRLFWHSVVTVLQHQSIIHNYQVKPLKAPTVCAIPGRCRWELTTVRELWLSIHSNRNVPQKDK